MCSSDQCDNIYPNQSDRKRMDKLFSDWKDERIHHKVWTVAKAQDTCHTV